MANMLHVVSFYFFILIMLYRVLVNKEVYVTPSEKLELICTHLL